MGIYWYRFKIID